MAVLYIYIVMFAMFILDAILFIYILSQKLIRNRRERLKNKRKEDLIGIMSSYINGEDTDLSSLTKTDRLFLYEICVESLPAFEKENRTAMEPLLKDIGAYDRLMKNLQSKRKYNRLESIRVIGYVGILEAIPTLLHMLFDNDSDIRYAAARSLALIGADLYLPYVMDSLSQEGYYNPRKIVEIFSLIDAHTEVLKTMVSSNDIKYKLVAVMAIGRLKDSQYIPQLVDAACTDDKEVKIRALNSILEIGSDLSDYLDRIRPCGKDTAWEVRAAYAKLLSIASSEDVLIELSHLIEDENWWVRVNAATSLLKHGEEGINMLRSIARESSDRFSRELATQYLERYVWRGQYA